MPKISKAQMAILKRMAAGEIMRVEDSYAGHRSFLFPSQAAVLPGTSARLIQAGLVEIAFPLTRRYEGDLRGSYKLSDTGRSLVEQEAAKERGEYPQVREVNGDYFRITINQQGTEIWSPMSVSEVERHLAAKGAEAQ